MGTIFARAGRLVAARRAGGVFAVHAHRGAVDPAGQDGLGELGEDLGVDLVEQFNPRIRAAVWILITMQSGSDYYSPSTFLITVVVINKGRLAQERLPALLDLPGRERVVVVVGARADRPAPDVQVARPRGVVEADPVGSLAQAAAGMALGHAPGVEHGQGGVLAQHGHPPEPRTFRAPGGVSWS